MNCPGLLADDGTTVTLDLHGCSVEDGIFVLRRTLQEALRRGRTKVDVIHGSSTSLHSRHSRTIKNELMDRLQRGAFSEWTSGHTTDASGGRTSLWIYLGVNASPARIRAEDVARPRR
jgi:DNA-nicking Smr family endonuclease